MPRVMWGRELFSSRYFGGKDENRFLPRNCPNRMTPGLFFYQLPQLPIIFDIIYNKLS